MTDCIACSNEIEDSESSTYCDECKVNEPIRTQLDSLVETYNITEKAIHDLLESMTSYGGECNCGNTERFDYIFDGEFREMHSVCLYCGGYVEVME